MSRDLNLPPGEGRDGWWRSRGGQVGGDMILEVAWGFGKELTPSRTPDKGPWGADARAMGQRWARAPTTLFIFALLPPQNPH